MSRYGHLVCKECHVSLFLGKAVFPEGKSVDYFQVGMDDPNSRQLDRTRALWKMLADHIGHPLKVVLEGQDRNEDDEIAEYSAIGGISLNDISFSEYLKNWKG